MVNNSLKYVLAVYLNYMVNKIIVNNGRYNILIIL